MRFLVRLAPLLLAAAAACSTIPALDTPSGKPEVTVEGAAPREVLSAAAFDFGERGFVLHQRGPDAAVFLRPVDDLETNLLAGAKLSSKPYHRVRVRVRQLPHSVQVHADIEVVFHEGTEEERHKDASRSNEIAREVQDTLELVVGTVALQRHARSIRAAEMEARPPAGEPSLWTGGG